MAEPDATNSVTLNMTPLPPSVALGNLGRALGALGGALEDKARQTVHDAYGDLITSFHAAETSAKADAGDAAVKAGQVLTQLEAAVAKVEGTIKAAFLSKGGHFVTFIVGAISGGGVVGAVAWAALQYTR